MYFLKKGGKWSTESKIDEGSYNAICKDEVSSSDSSNAVRAIRLGKKIKPKGNIVVLKDMVSGEIDAILEANKPATEVENIIRNVRFSKGWDISRILDHIERAYDIKVIADYTECHADNFEISY